MNPNVRGTALEGKYQEGDSFLPEFEKRTAPWSEYFQVNAGDIKAARGAADRSNCSSSMP